MLRNRLSFSRGSSLAAAACAAVAVAGLATAGAVHASVINIQFTSDGSGYGPQSFSGNKGAYTGDGVAAPIWNVAPGLKYGETGFGSGSINDLTASDGTATTYGVSYTYQGDYATYNTSPQNQLLQQYINSVSSYGQGVTLNGLTDSAVYQLYLYASNGGYGGGASKFSITAGTGGPISGSNAATTGNASGSTSGDFTENSSYVIFDITASATGTIGITSNPISGTPSYSNDGLINGLQLISPVPAAVPEPATLGLVVAGGFGLLLAGRKRKVT